MMIKGLETCLHAFRDQIKSESDILLLFVHWHLVNKGFQCVVDGKKTEILPADWNANDCEYIISYTHDSKGYELKMITVDQAVIINLMKKSNERTANVTCNPKDHVVNYKNEFQNLFINMNDLFEKIEKEFVPLINENMSNEKKEKENKASTGDSQTYNDPLRVPGRGGNFDPRLSQPYSRPDNYGRSDLEPFGGFDPMRVGGNGGGMIFDPFRGSNRPRIPGNLPPGAVPPGARFDPFGPPAPDDLTGTSSMRVGPNPSHLRPPQFDDQFM